MHDAVEGVLPPPRSGMIVPTAYGRRGCTARRGGRSRGGTRPARLRRSGSSPNTSGRVSSSICPRTEGSSRTGRRSSARTYMRRPGPETGGASSGGTGARGIRLRFTSARSGGIQRVVTRGTTARTTWHCGREYSVPRCSGEDKGHHKALDCVVVGNCRREMIEYLEARSNPPTR